MKKFFLHYHMMLIGILLIVFMSFYVKNLNYLAVSTLVFIFFTSVILIVIYKLEYSIIKHFTFLYLLFTGIFLWLFVLCLWRYLPSVFILFTLFPVGVSIIYPLKIVFRWIIGICLVALITIILPDPGLPYKVDPQKDDFMVFFSFSAILFFLIYYNIKITLDKFEILKNSMTHSNDKNIEDENKEIYEQLYEEIIRYFEAHDPWKNPDFSIQDLAHHLNSNSTYISRAINQRVKINFKTFVNSFRINYIKDELKTGNNYNRYKLIHLYTNAGFKHQSTFNKVFRHLENMTPTEYISSINKKMIDYEED